MIEISLYVDEADELRGLDVYNAVWPEDRLGVEEERSYRAGLREYVDLLARIDGIVGGSALAAIQPQRPELVFALVTVLPEYRGLGVGTGLYGAVSGWAQERGLDTIQTVVADDDHGSLAFAQRRGFAEESHQKGVSLDLREIQLPRVELPEGVEIVTWAERPELARGIYEVVLEAMPDIPGEEDEQVEPFEDWLAHDMQGPGDRPEATFVAVTGDPGDRLREVLALRDSFHDGPSRPDGRQAGLARPRRRTCAEGDADRVGEGERLRGAAHHQR